VAVEQLRIGDNDTLSAHVATLVRADWLFLLTDVDALYTANPTTDPSATPIREVLDLWQLDVDTSTRGTEWGTGGMGTKLTAGRIATAGGCNVVISHFARPASVLAVLRGEAVGTVFHAAAEPVRTNHKRWVLSVPVTGEVRLDSGAVRAVRERRASLFSAGIVGVEGRFRAQEAVRICDAEGREFARGLVNYGSDDVDRFKVRAAVCRDVTIS
jgi:glutamate 5-kinase